MLNWIIWDVQKWGRSTRTWKKEIIVTKVPRKRIIEELPLKKGLNWFNKNYLIEYKKKKFWVDFYNNNNNNFFHCTQAFGFVCILIHLFIWYWEQLKLKNKKFLFKKNLFIVCFHRTKIAGINSNCKLLHLEPIKKTLVSTVRSNQIRTVRKRTFFISLQIMNSAFWTKNIFC